MLGRLSAHIANRLPVRRWGGRFGRDEAGATAVEYGLILAGIAMFILVAVFAMGDELNNLFTAVQTKLANSTT